MAALLGCRTVFASNGGRTGTVWCLGFGAFPGFNLEVHGVFVAFPVVLTAETAWAFGEGAAVGTGMSFDVFTWPC